MKEWLFRPKVSCTWKASLPSSLIHQASVPVLFLKNHVLSPQIGSELSFKPVYFVFVTLRQLVFTFCWLFNQYPKSFLDLEWPFKYSVTRLLVIDQIKGSLETKCTSTSSDLTAFFLSEGRELLKIYLLAWHLGSSILCLGLSCISN